MHVNRIENHQANPTINAIEVMTIALGMTAFDLFVKIKPQR